LTLAQQVDGSRQMTLRLHPADMGMVQVHIGYTAVGSAHIEITTDKAETLQILQRDQAQFHNTLDQAGVPATGRTLTFHAASPSPATGDGSGAAASNQGSTPGYAPGNGGQSGGRSPYSGSDASGGDSAGRQQGQSAGSQDGVIGMVSYRIGLDILA
jgi:hypothetical protein